MDSHPQPINPLWVFSEGHINMSLSLSSMSEMSLVPSPTLWAINTLLCWLLSYRCDKIVYLGSTFEGVFMSGKDNWSHGMHSQEAERHTEAWWFKILPSQQSRLTTLLALPKVSIPIFPLHAGDRNPGLPHAVQVYYHSAMLRSVC